MSHNAVVDWISVINFSVSNPFSALSFMNTKLSYNVLGRNEIDVLCKIDYLYQCTDMVASKIGSFDVKFWSCYVTTQSTTLTETCHLNL